MKPVEDQLAALLPVTAIPHAEMTSMPYLGYHLLRQTLTQQLLGSSEAPILHWLGKDIGRQIPIHSAQGLVLPFIRLGLGKLELMQESPDRYLYRLTHPMFEHLPIERLGTSLSLECGILAGALGQWRGMEADVKLELHHNPADKRREARISVTLIPPRE
ncbi:DUF2507 domain-containing protein [Brevibacillus sp. SYP-B805]|uniref:DUF2507 domain-containing protein n=1 Tax=Brevibacillus sp. SYP-B805 TaxID=1578199 RepID=UPI0013EA5BB2|nr:DUF2507 domain-containing protein [Brevibacillus sp. SYP-B805]NGQ94410.1 DUF2507 domain-containing protein [Brevibacillus sp. SYP-B805]